MFFDLLIKGGELIDPASDRHGLFDVAIHRGRIAAVDREIPTTAAARVIDATGQIVTPGLVDLHTHVYHHVTYWGIQADPVAARTGVTTWLDVGSAGGYNLMGLREFIAKPATARIYALLNISSIGLTAPTWELSNLAYCDVDLCCNMLDLNRDLVLGIKARIDANTTGPQGIEPLRRARVAADRCQVPLMVHIGQGPPAITDVLSLLRPGDILTHCFTGGTMRIVDEKGKLLEAARRAWDNGIIMDVGHGAGSFSFEVAEQLLAAGHRPDVISSDIHQSSILGPLFDLPTCMSKFLLLGMSLPEVIRAATARPAEVLGLQHEIGTLKPGAMADVALFTLEKGDFTFYDVHMTPRSGRRWLRNTLTLIAGRELPRLPDPPSAPWIEPGEGQRALQMHGHTPDRWQTRNGPGQMGQNQP
ncbi:amidohydrolase/deacetylase family metallohydrolase [Litorilinea aerophila]|uniref:Amidohydrolase/deacetylase family metallohydrolase n=1 Tax=Litorilinea aerophila TaxID=1204385 RepID=A0A540VBI7_9CHLR|nr:amidohydrolase/deacetylase family metallohydrolase [Litorilinea aerophila]MCC9078010.1 amidohydrolase/deacetylase family metallohydrolase [Litorilinea aerophila]